MTANQLSQGFALLPAEVQKAPIASVNQGTLLFLEWHTGWAGNEMPVHMSIRLLASK